MVNVDDLKNRWCPFSRRYEADEVGGAVSTNRPEKNDRGVMYASLKCIGPFCMAWRWSQADPHDDGMLGYCGLAGKPEDE